MYTIFHLGNYGNQIDGVNRPASAKKKKEGGGESEEEESELIHNSSDEEAEDDGDLMSVPSTPPMKPVITDRSEVKERERNYGFEQNLYTVSLTKVFSDWKSLTHATLFISSLSKSHFFYRYQLLLSCLSWNWTVHFARFTEITSTCLTLKRNPVFTSRAGGRTRGDGSTTPI